MSPTDVNGVADSAASGNGASPREPAGQASFALSEAASRRPEVAVGAAFLGGLLLALLIRRVRS